MNNRLIPVIFLKAASILLLILVPCRLFSSGEVKPGAYYTESYLPLLEGKRVAVTGNHTSVIGKVHLVDTLISSGVEVVRVFSPEHGFRGEAAAGEYVDSGRDPVSGVEITSLYGTNRRPYPDQLSGIDIIVFDIQDVGVRFYTYLSTMSYVMEEAAALGIPMVILDRPNPLGFYTDGPILQKSHSSFVGLHPVPVVHGMTPGEFALMIRGEGWIENYQSSELTVIKAGNYSRSSRYELQRPPSPNLPNMKSVYLYPTLCFFEGTRISVGRGTEKPFQVYGHSRLPASKYSYSFIPESMPSAPNPPELGKQCNGRDLSLLNAGSLKQKNSIWLDIIIEAYQDYPDKDDFFNNFFDTLAGGPGLRSQIIRGYSAEEIKESWQQGLKEFEALRSEYLLYPDN